MTTALGEIGRGDDGPEQYREDRDQRRDEHAATGWERGAGAFNTDAGDQSRAPAIPAPGQELRISTCVATH